jgi:phage-related protein
MTGSMDQPVWLYSTLEDLRASSAEVRGTMGGAIRAAQFGEMSDDAEPMKGDLREVVEIRAHDRDGIYRMMYTTKIGDVLIVLDFFKKKGVAGGATPKVDLDRIRQRYKKAKEQYGTSKGC